MGSQSFYAVNYCGVLYNTPIRLITVSKYFFFFSCHPDGCKNTKENNTMHINVF